MKADCSVLCNPVGLAENYLAFLNLPEREGGYSISGGQNGRVPE